jgi:Mrr N-terminal domain
MNKPAPFSVRCSLAVKDFLRGRGEQNRRAIYRHAAQSNRFTADEHAAPQPPGCTGNHTTLVEYGISFALTKLKKAGEIEHVSRGQWRLPD